MTNVRHFLFSSPDGASSNDICSFVLLIFQDQKEIAEKTENREKTESMADQESPVLPGPRGKMDCQVQYRKLGFAFGVLVKGYSKKKCILNQTTQRGAVFCIIEINTFEVFLDVAKFWPFLLYFMGIFLANFFLKRIKMNST